MKKKETLKNLIERQDKELFDEYYRRLEPAMDYKEILEFVRKVRKEIKEQTLKDLK